MAKSRLSSISPESKHVDTELSTNIESLEQTLQTEVPLL